MRLHLLRAYSHLFKMVSLMTMASSFRACAGANRAALLGGTTVTRPMSLCPVHHAGHNNTSPPPIDEEYWRDKILDRLPRRWCDDRAVLQHYEIVHPWSPPTDLHGCACYIPTDDAGHECNKPDVEAKNTKKVMDYCDWYRCQRKVKGDEGHEDQRRYFSSESKPPVKPPVDKAQGKEAKKEAEKKKIDLQPVDASKKANHVDKVSCFLGPFCNMFKGLSAKGNTVAAPAEKKAAEFKPPAKPASISAKDSKPTTAVVAKQTDNKSQSSCKTTKTKKSSGCEKPKAKKDICKKPEKKSTTCAKPKKESSACKPKKKSTCEKPKKDTCKKPEKKESKPKGCAIPKKKSGGCEIPKKKSVTCKTKKKSVCKKPKKDVCKKPEKKSTCKTEKKSVCKKPKPAKKSTCKMPKKDKCKKPKQDKCKKPKKSTCKKPKKKDECKKPKKTTCKKPEKKKSCSDTCSDKKPFNPNNCGCHSHITKPHKVGRDGVPCPSETSVSSCKKTKNDKCSKKCKSAPTNSCTVDLCANDKDKVFDMKTCSKIKEKKKSLKNKVFSVKSCQDGECDDGGCKGSGSSCGKGGVKCAGISGVRYMSYASSRNDCDGCKQDDGDCNEEKSCKKKSGVFNASMMKSHDEENGECKATSKTSLHLQVKSLRQRPKSTS